ncbi:MAG: hypothetical protein AUI14_21960 [Actinobacteria bacterium 13_2_20CM_2_71_6]|nr:MAG: hypothetical protein AUI14_21960 [Actinobacteria bacterium 13_2_20CM_2_71_6]
MAREHCGPRIAGHLAQRFVERSGLPGFEGLDQLRVELPGELPRTPAQPGTFRGQLDQGPAPVGAVPYPLDRAEPLQLVEHVDDHAGGHADRAREFELGHRRRTQQLQDGAVSRAQPERGEPVGEPVRHQLTQLAEQEAGPLVQRLFCCHPPYPTVGL